MGLAHYRLGPNKVVVKGTMQPFRDVIKLMAKGERHLKLSNVCVFFMRPFALLLVSLIMWSILWTWGRAYSSKFTLLTVMLLGSLAVFFILCIGWVGGSFYRILGRYRSTAQMISYEGLFFFAICIVLWTLSQMGIKMPFALNRKVSLVWGIYPLVLFWLLSLLAETNRTPFDFAEGERELVSGFNTEYSSGLFSLIFLREYINILFFMLLSCYLFVGVRGNSIFALCALVYIAVGLRCCYPRFRYDILMLWSWKVLIVVITPLAMAFFYINNF